MTWPIFRRPSGKGAGVVANETRGIDFARIHPPVNVTEIPAETKESEGEELARQQEKDRIEREKDVYTFRKSCT